MPVRDTAEEVRKKLESLADPEKAVILSRFFKTGRGEYGEGDIFWGIKVPEQRRVAREFRDIPLSHIKRLLTDPVHECRLTSLMILVDKYAKAGPELREEIFSFYLSCTEFINNWDLVDLSCEKIVGRHLHSTGSDRSILYRLAESESIWEQRIAVISTFRFIKNMEFEDTLKLCELLLDHRHDLIHKATGWMLRETGKRSIVTLRTFLDSHADVMPRTMLRYAIEKLDEKERRRYMDAKRAGRGE